tara:strand:- start:110 stop:274 length:165 start_codon:yes stop_codon:yes gene_type:complete
MKTGPVYRFAHAHNLHLGKARRSAQKTIFTERNVMRMIVGIAVLEITVILSALS